MERVILNEFLNRLKEAEMILVGFGEEFDVLYDDTEKFHVGKQYLEENHLSWMLPGWMEYCANSDRTENLRELLSKFSSLFEDKNVFFVSTATNSLFHEIVWKNGRIVCPCGGCIHKQCGGESTECGSDILPLSDADFKKMQEFFDSIAKGAPQRLSADLLGACRHCKKPYVYNSIYTHGYNENGYLSDWANYTKWLQTTINRKLLILELGVGMQHPSVIRWPFEKIAFYNQKSTFIRVNETLWQVTEGIKERSIPVAKNAIEWLNDLC